MLSKRAFLTGGIGVALVAPSISPAKLQSEDIIKHRRDQVTSPERWYSSEDAGDWVPAFERAQKYAAVIRLQARTYDLSRAIFCQSHTRWVGSGANTRVRNIRQSHKVLRGIFFAGNMHPAALECAARAGNLPAFETGSQLQGLTQITLKNIADSAEFSSGQQIFTRARAFETASGYRYARSGQFNVVEHITGATLDLRYPILETVEEGYALPIGKTIDPFLEGIGFPQAWHLVEDLHVESMTIDADYVCSTRTGMIECYFKNLHVENSVSPFAVNSLVRCRVEDIKASDCKRRVVELKCFSDSSAFYDIDARVIGDDGDFDTVIDVGENTKNVILSGVNVTIAETATANRFLFQVSGRQNLLENFDFSCLNSTPNYVPMFISPSATGGPALSCTVRNGTVRTRPTSARHIQVGGTADDKFIVSGYRIDNVTFIGDTSARQSVRINTTGGGIIENCSFFYPISIGEGATPPSTKNNRIILSK